MKPESVKTILKAYLEQKQYSSTYDDIDGFDCDEHMSGEPYDYEGGRTGDLSFVHRYSPALPLSELDVPLPPEERRLATQFGRQLSEMSDEFEADHSTAARKRGSVDGTRSVHFPTSVINVPPTSDRAEIPVIRKLALDSEVNVTWRTSDKSAKAGLHYVDSQGNISFIPGDAEKTIEVEMIKDQARKAELHFAVELYDAKGTFNTIDIYILDDSKLYPEEKIVVENIYNIGRNISVSEVVSRLSDNVTRNTFKAALRCLTSTANSIPKEFAFAAELYRLTIPYARPSLLTKVLCEFLIDKPELEELASELDSA